MFSWLSPAEKKVIGAVLALALVLRIIVFPGLHETRDTDEVGYTKAGLATLEGIAPGSKASPGAPITWVGFAYAGADAFWNLIHPAPDVKAVPFVVRPYMAVEHSLFDNYRDPGPMRRFILIVFQFIILGGVLGASLMGAKRAGIWGAVLLGVIAAAMPMYVMYACQSRPYAVGWAFTFMAFAAAIVAQRRPHRWACIYMGLAIASRIDLVVLVPLLLWELHRRGFYGSAWRAAWKPLLHIAAVTLLVAPWLTTSTLGDLRTILTVRFFPAPSTETSGSILLDLAWYNALGFVVIFFLLGWIFLPRTGRRGQVLFLGYVALLSLTMTKGSGYGLRHHGAVVIALIFGGLTGLAAVLPRFPRVAQVLVGLTVLLTLVEAGLAIVKDRRSFTGEESTQWLEQHVKPGSSVLLDVSTFNPVQVPVPTRTASDALWNGASSIEAGETKFLSGVKRFNLPRGTVPRALSEENLVQEKANARTWFILGSSIEPSVPRFDLALSGISPVFFVPTDDIIDVWHKRGGALVTAQPKMIDALGPPTKLWQSPGGQRVAIYVQSDALLPESGK